MMFLLLIVEAVNIQSYVRTNFKNAPKKYRIISTNYITTKAMNNTITLILSSLPLIKGDVDVRYNTLDEVTTFQIRIGANEAKMFCDNPHTDKKWLMVDPAYSGDLQQGLIYIQSLVRSQTAVKEIERVVQEERVC